MYMVDKLEQDIDKYCTPKPQISTLCKWCKGFQSLLQCNTPFSKEDISGLANCVIKYLWSISNYCTLEEFNNEKSKQAVAELLHIIPDVGKLQGVRNDLLEEISNPVYEILLDPSLNMWCGREILKVFNYLVMHSDRKLRHTIISQNNKMHLYKLVDLLSTCGDYEHQVTILENIFRMCSLEQIKSYSHDLFPEEKKLGERLAAIRAETFDSDVRMFLTALNRRKTGVFSIVSRLIVLDNMEVATLNCYKDIGFWIDFNAGPNTISFYCNTENLESEPPAHSETETWELITLPDTSVKEVKIKLMENIYHIRLNLCGPLNMLYNMNGTVLNTKHITMCIEESERASTLCNLIIPSMFGNKFLYSEESPPSQENTFLESNTNSDKQRKDLVHKLNERRSSYTMQCVSPISASSKSIPEVLQQHELDFSKEFCGGEVPALLSASKKETECSNSSKHSLLVTAEHFTVNSKLSSKKVGIPQNDLKLSCSTYDKIHKNRTKESTASLSQAINELPYIATNDTLASKKECKVSESMADDESTDIIKVSMSTSEFFVEEDNSKEPSEIPDSEKEASWKKSVPTKSSHVAQTDVLLENNNSQQNIESSKKQDSVVLIVDDHEFEFSEGKQSTNVNEIDENIEKNLSSTISLTQNKPLYNNSSSKQQLAKKSVNKKMASKKISEKSGITKGQSNKSCAEHNKTTKLIRPAGNNKQDVKKNISSDFFEVSHSKDNVILDIETQNVHKKQNEKNTRKSPRTIEKLISVEKTYDVRKQPKIDNKKSINNLAVGNENECAFQKFSETISDKHKQNRSDTLNKSSVTQSSEIKFYTDFEDIIHSVDSKICDAETKKLQRIEEICKKLPLVGKCEESNNTKNNKEVVDDEQQQSSKMKLANNFTNGSQNPEENQLKNSKQSQKLSNAPMPSQLNKRNLRLTKQNLEPTKKVMQKRNKTIIKTTDSKKEEESLSNYLDNLHNKKESNGNFTDKAGATVLNEDNFIATVDHTITTQTCKTVIEDEYGRIEESKKMLDKKQVIVDKHQPPSNIIKAQNIQNKNQDDKTDEIDMPEKDDAIDLKSQENEKNHCNDLRSFSQETVKLIIPSGLRNHIEQEIPTANKEHAEKFSQDTEKMVDLYINIHKASVDNNKTEAKKPEVQRKKRKYSGENKENEAELKCDGTHQIKKQKNKKLMKKRNSALKKSTTCRKHLRNKELLITINTECLVQGKPVDVEEGNIRKPEIYANENSVKLMHTETVVSALQTCKTSEKLEINRENKVHKRLLADISNINNGYEVDVNKTLSDLELIAANSPHNIEGRTFEHKAFKKKGSASESSYHDNEQLKIINTEVLTTTEIIKLGISVNENSDKFMENTVESLTKKLQISTNNENSKSSLKDVTSDNSSNNFNECVSEYKQHKKGSHKRINPLLSSESFNDDNQQFNIINEEVVTNTDINKIGISVDKNSDKFMENTVESLTKKSEINTNNEHSKSSVKDVNSDNSSNYFNECVSEYNQHKKGSHKRIKPLLSSESFNDDNQRLNIINKEVVTNTEINKIGISVNENSDNFMENTVECLTLTNNKSQINTNNEHSKSSLKDVTSDISSNHFNESVSEYKEHKKGSHKRIKPLLSSESSIDDNERLNIINKEVVTNIEINKIGISVNENSNKLLKPSVASPARKSQITTNNEAPKRFLKNVTNITISNNENKIEVLTSSESSEHNYDQPGISNNANLSITDTNKINIVSSTRNSQMNTNNEVSKSLLQGITNNDNEIDLSKSSSDLELYIADNSSDDFKQRVLQYKKNKKRSHKRVKALSSSKSSELSDDQLSHKSVATSGNNEQKILQKIEGNVLKEFGNFKQKYPQELFKECIQTQYLRNVNKKFKYDIEDTLDTNQNLANNLADSLFALPKANNQPIQAHMLSKNQTTQTTSYFDFDNNIPYDKNMFPTKRRKLYDPEDMTYLEQTFIGSVTYFERSMAKTHIKQPKSIRNRNASFPKFTSTRIRHKSRYAKKSSKNDNSLTLACNKRHHKFPHILFTNFDNVLKAFAHFILHEDEYLRKFINHGKQEPEKKNKVQESEEKKSYEKKERRNQKSAKKYAKVVEVSPRTSTRNFSSPIKENDGTHSKRSKPLRSLDKETAKSKPKWAPLALEQEKRNPKINVISNVVIQKAKGTG